MLDFMARLDKNDLAQMNRDYFQSLEKERLVEVATNLHQLAVEQWEKQQENSENSSRPPSSDNPYNKAVSEEQQKANQQATEQETETESKEVSGDAQQSRDAGATGTQANQDWETNKKSPGKQPGAPGKWRTTPLVAEVIIPHYPSQCAACNQPLTPVAPKPYMGHYVLEARKRELRLPGCLPITPLLWVYLHLRTYL